MKNKRLILILGVAAMLLSVPFFAMQFTNEVNWDAFDFLIMGVLLVGTGLMCELVMRKVKRISQRLILCGVLLLMFLLVWAELAVGIFGSVIAGS